MRPAGMFAWSGFGLMALMAIILGYWFATIENVGEWNNEYKLVPVYFFFVGIGLLAVGGTLNHYDDKSGKGSQWGGHWEDI